MEEFETTNADSEHTASDFQPQQDGRLSAVLVHLLKGIIYREQQSQLWSQLLRLETKVRDYLQVLGLTLTLDMDEGYAYVAQDDDDDSESEIPKLIAKRPLSYEASLMAVLLRKRLAEADRESGSSKVIVEREQIHNMMQTWLGNQNNEAKQKDQVEALINQMLKLGLLRKMKEDNHFEISRIIKAFVDAQWLISLDEKLAAYQAQ